MKFAIPLSLRVTSWHMVNIRYTVWTTAYSMYRAGLVLYIGFLKQFDMYYNTNEPILDTYHDTCHPTLCSSERIKMWGGPKRWPTTCIINTLKHVTQLIFGHFMYVLYNLFLNLYNFDTLNKLNLKQNVSFESIVWQNELIWYCIVSQSINTYDISWTDVEL